MIWNRFESDKPYMNHFANPVLDEGSGITDMTELKHNILSMYETMKDLPHPIIKARIFKYIVENIAVGYNPNTWFGVTFAGRKPYPPDKPFRWIANDIWEQEYYYKDNNWIGQALTDYQACGLTFAYPDFDHGVPDWRAIMKLGFRGLLQRVKDNFDKHQSEDHLTEKQRVFYQATILTLESCLTFCKRILESARRHLSEDDRMPMVVESLEHIYESKVENFYDALQLNLVYYFLQNYLDNTACRSLGNLDQLLYPYYTADIESDRFTREQISELVKYFMVNIDQQYHYNNQPFYMGGTAKDGSSLINDLSFLLLDAHDQCGVISPKLFLKIAPNSPDAWLRKIMDMIRRGHSSMVLINETVAIKSLLAAGVTEEEARDFLCTGCYEIQVLCEENMTASVYCNLVKCLELTLNQGYDKFLDKQIGIDVGDPTTFQTFDELFEAWQKETSFLLHRLANMNNAMEEYMPRINPTNLFSSSIGSCVERGIDAFDVNGVKYNNSEMMMSGMATLTDSLYMMEKYIYREKKVTMEEYLRAIRSNWVENEELHATICADPEKYGNDISGPDAMLKRITDWIAPYTNAIPTSRGGLYKTSYESIQFCYIFGEKCAASPDGRMDGEIISKNLSPTIGQDRNGITAFLHSVTKINTLNNRASAPVDFILHPSAVQGNEGLDAMVALVRTYFKRGGLSLQGNIISAETLHKAQENPAEYANLQIRVCGWNWYFTNMTKEDQDWFIRQAEAI